MRLLKRAIQAVLAARGLELNRISRHDTGLANFTDLAHAYEHYLNQAGIVVPPNEKRAKLLAGLLGTRPAEAYFIIQAIHRCLGVDGDVCEFGVAQGTTSALIANELMGAGSQKTLHLFDSFAGLSRPTQEDTLKDDIEALGSMEAYAGAMAYPEAMVKIRLAAVSFPPDRYVIHKGFVDEVLRRDRDLPLRVCFAYVDFDLYAPIKAALEFLHSVASPGAMVMVDDYDFFSTGVKKAVDEFVEAHGGHERDGGEYELLLPDPVFGHFVVLTKRG